MPKIKRPAEVLPMKVWRYMKLEYFQFLLAHRSLWFSSADSFPDQWEGAYTLAEVQHRERLWNEINNPEGARDSVRAIADWNRKATFVNCWSANDYECALMWQSYVEGQGVAIQSTIGRLERALPEWVRLVPIRYIDHDTPNIPSNHSLDPFGWKQMEFSAERELRLTIANLPPQHPLNRMRIVPKGYRLVEVDLEVLLESIVVAPGSSDAIFDLVRDLVANAKLHKPLLPSRLSLLPYH